MAGGAKGGYLCPVSTNTNSETTAERMFAPVAVTTKGLPDAIVVGLLVVATDTLNLSKWASR